MDRYRPKGLEGTVIKQRILTFILVYSVGLLFLPAFASTVAVAGDELHGQSPGGLTSETAFYPRLSGA